MTKACPTHSWQTSSQSVRRLTEDPTRGYGGEVDLDVPVQPEPGQVSTTTDQPGLAARTKRRLNAAGADWLCAWCLNRVANEKERFRYDGKDEFSFCNPEGICFEIITFSQTLGCVQTGVPTLAHTWFPGCAWSFCQCDRCGRHLGWFYSGEHDFAGLIRSRLVRGVLVRN
jgi:hypothetical protein